MSVIEPEGADGRRPVVTDIDDAIALLEDGMTLGIGGFINSGHPMTLVRAIMRRGLRDLVIVGAASSGLELDMLIASGCARKIVSPYVGAEGLAGIGPAFRRAAQEGELELFELDEAHYYAGLRAAAQNLPFNPWKAGVGTSYPQVNQALKEFRDPISDELLLAVPAIELDVAILHAAVSDVYGNVQHNGTGFGDRAIAAAADRTIVQVEQLVENERIRANPSATTVAGATMVVRAPYGAHPFASEGYYPPDTEHLREYLDAATEWLRTGSRGRLDEYFGRYVFEPADLADYIAAVGIRRVLSLSEVPSNAGHEGSVTQKSERDAALAQPTPKEIMATVIAHDLRDGEWVEVGANLPVPRAGALMAHLTHGPNMTVMLAMTKAYLRDEPLIEEFDFVTDVRAMRWAEAYYPHDRLLSDMRFRRRGVFFCGGIQIDRYGNSNLIGIGSDYKRLQFRGPGGIGTCNATVQNGRYHLVTTSHSPRVLVERCDYISALGWGDGNGNVRAELGLPNEGPKFIITPLCVFDFDPESHAARLKSVHPGVEVDEVVAQTGFSFDVPSDVPVTPGPSEEELSLLRTRIDPRGALR